MKFMSRLMQVFTAATVSLSCLLSMPTMYSVNAEGGICGAKANWDLTNGKLTISGTGTVQLCPWQGAASQITELVVEDGITTINSSLFKDHTALKKVTIADSVTTIGLSAFNGCTALESVDLSDSLQVINSSMFRFCFSLKDVHFPENLVEIKSSAFFGCLELESIELPPNVKTIQDHAFSGCGLQSVTLNDGLQTIGESAFKTTCFPIINIPESVTSIGADAFGQVYTNVMEMNGLIYGGYSGNKAYVTIYGKSGSAAETYAKENGLEFHEGVYVEHTCSGVWLTEVIATCQTEGLRYYICSVCGKKETEVIPIGDHLMGDWVVSKQPTCTESGVETKTCQYCPKSESRDIAPSGHKMGDWKLTTKPTCTKEGVETQSCSACTHTNTRSVSATGHSYGEWVVTKKPGCTQEGVETQTCSGCGDEKTRSVAATGHSHGDWVLTKQPTCTEAGVETQTCSGCGDAKTRSVEALGHNFGGWSQIQAPTFTENGVEQRTCGRCSEAETRPIAKLEGYTVSASCSNGGSISPDGSQTYLVGTSVTYEFTPSEGYQIADVLVDNQSIGKQTAYTFYNLTANHSLRVEYEKIPIIPSCSIITVTPKKSYWTPDEKAFAMSDFTITAKIISGDEVSMIDITNQCVANDSPKSFNDRNAYGSVQLTFRYTGNDSAILTYLKSNSISGFVTVALKGDGNMDGIIDADDSCMALSAYVIALSSGVNVLTDAEFALMNIVKDGRMDADDATAILRYYVDGLTGGKPSWKD